MSDDTNRVRPFPASGASSGELPEPGPDLALKEVLQHWQAPMPPEALEIRLLESHRVHVSARPRGVRRLRALLSLAATIAIGLGAWWTISVLQGPNVSAAELLSSAATSERAWLAEPQAIVHRSLSLEERRLPENVVIRTRRVDVWQHGARGVMVRRVYDAADTLTAGEWIDRNDGRTLYRPGVGPASMALDPRSTIATSEDLWRLDLSAATFAALAPAAGTRVTRQRDRLILAWHSEAASGLTDAELTLERDTLRPLAQSFTIRDGDAGQRRIRFAELSFARVAPSDVPAARFEPEPRLLPAAAAATAAPAKTPVAPEIAPKPSAAPLDALELDAWYRAHLLGLVFERDVDVGVAPAGIVRMRVRVANEFRRAALASRLSEWDQHPSTALEFADPRSAGGAASDANETPPGSPLLLALHEHFAATLASDAAATAVRTTLSAVREELERHRTRVRALRAFLARWPVESLRGTPEDTVTHWSTVVRDHALSIGEGAERLRTMVSPLSTAVPATNLEQPGSSITTVQDLPPALAGLLDAARVMTERLDAALGESTSASALTIRELANAVSDVEGKARPFAGAWYFSR